MPSTLDADSESDDDDNGVADAGYNRLMPRHNPRASWAKAKAAARMSGTMQMRRIQSSLQQVEVELKQAEEELTVRKSEVEQADETLNSILPEGWREVIDQASGVSYYFNSHSGATTWERPSEASVAASTAAQSTTTTTAMVADELSQAGLPEGWVAAIDAESGSIYYYNAETGETSWEFPAVDLGPVQPIGEVPIWKAIGVKETSTPSGDLQEIEEAVASGDFERAISIRDNLRLASGRANSVHLTAAEL